MSLAKFLVVPLVAVVGVGAYMWSKGYRGPEGILERIVSGVEESHTVEVAPIDPLGETEGRWLVEEMARDIAEMVLLATDSKADPAQVLDLTVSRKTYGDVYELAVTGPKGEVFHAVTLKHHVWSPADHAPWAAALLKKWSPEKSPATTPDADGIALALQLTDSTTRTIIQEERRISKLLNKQPMDPELHEQAALVIGTFALREAAGSFNDVRPALCRMASHLALARALRPTPGTCGQLAEAVQLTLAVRQAEALEIVAKLPAGIEPWTTALKMRNTGDWRLCSDPAKATFLEQITWARATTLAVSPTPLQTFLGKHLPKSEAPDWSRAVMNSGYGVEHGHVFVKPCIALELADFAVASEAWEGRPTKQSNLLSYMNEPGCRAVGIGNGGFELSVLGWGQIAAFHQRHLCWATYSTDYFLRNLWGVPEQAVSLEQGVHSQFSRLRLYPLLVRRLMYGGSGQFLPKTIMDKAMRDAVKICNDQPQLVSPANWVLLAANAGNVMPEPPPPAKDWFQPSLPEGSAFDFEHRIYALHLPALPPGGKDYKSFWETMVARAPYDYDILRSDVASNPGTLLPAEREKQAYKGISEFNVHAMRKIASHLTKDAKAFASAMSLVCALDPDEYLTVAKILADAGLNVEAAVAYQAAFDKASDRVAMANNSDWIVNYYFDQGRKEDALKIATHAAEVYSGRGLETAGKLMERMEKWSEATAYYAAILERYDSPGPLMRFALRSKDRDPAMADLYQKMMDSKFPGGLKKVSFADFTDEPDKGVRFSGQSYHTRKWKLDEGDIIVALDGVLVESFPQYDMVRCLQPDTTPLALIIWDGVKYRELSAQVPERRFGCAMDTFNR
jgi:tetratricopeptide (TPR) repeat protein